MLRYRRWTSAFGWGGLIFILLALVQDFFTGTYTPGILVIGCVLLVVGLVAGIFVPLT